MQNLPNHPAEPMGDRPMGGLIAQSRQQAAEELKITASLLDCRVGCLVQDPSQILVSLGGATTVVVLALSSLPRQVPTQEVNSAAEENVPPCGPYLGNDLLRRIDSQARHFGRPHHCLLMRLHGLRDEVVEL